MSNCLTLKKSNCKNCYKCIRHCPVKSIRFSGNQAHIMDDECILCGQCFVVCPQNAKEITSELEKVKVLLNSNQNVYVSLAPSFIANYNGAGIESMKEALMALGFAGVEETAIGATIVKNEYEKLVNEQSQDVIITTCCHSVNLLIQKYFPDLLGSLANVMSPMQAHAMDIKKRHKDALVVFIGPCVAKKDEAAKYPGIVDAVLTFEELSEWLASKNIEIKKEKDYTQKSKTRLFPTAGGVLKTMNLTNKNYSYLAIDGAERCIAALKDIQSGKIHNCFIEMSSCIGSCIGGPVMEKYHKTPVEDFIEVTSYAGDEDYDVEMPSSYELDKRFSKLKISATTPDDFEINQILRKMGKFKPSDELNCGSCGYDTCRLKAIAIYQGKADISMCLPYLKDKAESFSDSIVKNTPNSLIVLNDNLEVQQINKAALELMNLRNESDVLGEGIIRILDPTVFVNVRSSKRSVHDQKVYLPEYKKYVRQTVLYDDVYKLIICIMRDITSEELARERKETISKQTIEIADKVVDKQMRIVQEIASLLGETAAETKITLTKLKESINNE